MNTLLGALTAWFQANSNIINTIGLNSLLALSLFLTLSCGLISLASAGQMAVGAYTSALLTSAVGWPFWLALPVGVLTAGLVALLLGIPILRLSGVYLAIATIGFVAIVQVFLLNWPPGGEGQGLTNIPQDTSTMLIYAALISVLFLLWRLDSSWVGRTLAAIRQDEPAARSLGINTTRYKLAIFVVSGMIAGLVGVLYAHLNYFIEPPDFDFGHALDALTYVVVGGSFSVLGAPLGAALLTILPNLLQFLQERRGIADGVILLLIILFLPNGLVDIPRRLRRAAPRVPARGG